MLYREIITVGSQIHTKHINTLCGQNAVSLFGYNWQYEQFKIRASTWTAELNDKSSATYPKDQLLFMMHVNGGLIKVCTSCLCFRRCLAVLSTPTPVLISISGVILKQWGKHRWQANQKGSHNARLEVLRTAGVVAPSARRLYASRFRWTALRPSELTYLLTYLLHAAQSFLRS